MVNRCRWFALLMLAFLLPLARPATGQAQSTATPRANPLFHDRFTADPAPLIVGDRLYLYVGHDEAQRDEMFNMREWLAYSTTDMRTWTDHGSIMRVADFKWAKQDAWASQMIQKNGRRGSSILTPEDDVSDKASRRFAPISAISAAPRACSSDAAVSPAAYSRMTPTRMTRP